MGVSEGWRAAVVWHQARACELARQDLGGPPLEGLLALHGTRLQFLLEARGAVLGVLGVLGRPQGGRSGDGGAGGPGGGGDAAAAAQAGQAAAELWGVLDVVAG